MGELLDPDVRALSSREDNNYSDVIILIWIVVNKSTGERVDCISKREVLDTLFRPLIEKSCDPEEWMVIHNGRRFLPYLSLGLEEIMGYACSRACSDCKINGWNQANKERFCYSYSGRRENNCKRKCKKE